MYPRGMSKLAIVGRSWQELAIGRSLLNILVAWWLSAIANLAYCGFILYYSHLYKGVSLPLYSIALINHVYHTTLQLFNRLSALIRATTALAKKIRIIGSKSKQVKAKQKRESKASK